MKWNKICALAFIVCGGIILIPAAESGDICRTIMGAVYVLCGVIEGKGGDE